MTPSETVETPYINVWIMRANNFFWIATSVSTPSLPRKSPEVWKLAMKTAQKGYEYNQLVREAARYLLNGNSDTAKANGKTLEELLQKASLRVPVCLKISADANYELAHAGYDKNRGAMSEAVRVHLTAAAIDYQLAFGEYAALENSLKQSLHRDFPMAVLNARFRSHYLLAILAYYRAERMKSGTTEKSKANRQALLDEAVQNFHASLDVIEIAKCHGLALPRITGQVARDVEGDLARMTARYGKTAASHAGTSYGITGVLRVIRTVE